MKILVKENGRTNRQGTDFGKYNISLPEEATPQKRSEIISLIGKSLQNTSDNKIIFLQYPGDGWDRRVIIELVDDLIDLVTGRKVFAQIKKVVNEAISDNKILLANAKKENLIEDIISEKLLPMTRKVIIVLPKSEEDFYRGRKELPEWLKKDVLFW